VKIRLKAKEVEIILDNLAHEFVIEKGYDPNYGARPMRRAVERFLKIRSPRKFCAATSKPAPKLASPPRWETRFPIRREQKEAGGANRGISPRLASATQLIHALASELAFSDWAC